LQSPFLCLFDGFLLFLLFLGGGFLFVLPPGWVSCFAKVAKGRVSPAGDLLLVLPKRRQNAR